MPHLAVVAFNLILIVLILMFIRFRLEKRLAKGVSLVLDVVIVLLLLALVFICFRFSSLWDGASDEKTLTMKTIEARITTNIKEDPSIEECDIWNIQATFLDPLSSDATQIMADPVEIGVKQLEAARIDETRTAVTVRTQQKKAW
jgi:hypothetical protein